MNIINSLREINKNSSSFKIWEAEQDSVDSKRKEMSKKNTPSTQELNEAQVLGKTIIDVVDIMDQHSEDVAENVETATSIPMSFVPMMIFAASSFVTGKFLLKPALKEIKAKREEFKNVNKEKINNLLEEFRTENPNKNKYIGEWEILDKRWLRGIDASDALKQKAEQIIKEMKEFQKKPINKGRLGLIIPVLTSIAAFVGGNVYATKMQIDGSKIARFQARKILNDPKYFVKYTPEQIAEAKKVLEADKTDKADKKTKTDKLKSGMFKSLSGILKDRNEYKKWRASEEAKPEKIARTLTPEETIRAKKDQEVIQRTVKKINNNAENYSQRMEVASGVIIGGTPVLGALIGLGVGSLLNALKILPKKVQRMVDKYGSEEAKTAYKDYASVAKDAPNKNKLFLKFAKTMMDSDLKKGVSNNIEEGFEKGLGKATKRRMGTSALEQMQEFLHKGLPIALSHKLGRKAIFGGISGILTGIVGAFIGLKLQKSSARAGRFVAKQELEKNPQNFIGYTDDELKNVADTSSQNKKTNKFKENLLFIPTVLKQYFAYSKYKKTQLKDEQLLQDQLVKLNVSETQLSDAKNLQRKVFNTFEEVDDKSQDYSESVEAAVEIAEPFVYAGGGLALVSPLIFFAIQASKGKLSAKSVTNKVLSVLSGSSKIMQKKFFKKYLTNVAKNIPHSVQNVRNDDVIFKKMLENVNLREMFAKRNDITYKEVLDVLAQNINKISDAELEQLVRDIKHSSFAKKNKFIQDIPTWNLDRAELTKNINDLSSQMGNQKILNGKEFKIDISARLNEFSQKLKDMPDAKVKENIIEFANQFDSIGFVRDLNLSSMDKASLEKTLSKVQTVIKNIPKEELKNIITTAIDEFNKNPDEFIKFVKYHNVGEIFMTDGLKKTLAISGLSWTAITMLATYAIESWLGELKLKAGRLGVMKALDSLKDPAYYANSEASTSKTESNK